MQCKMISMQELSTYCNDSTWLYLALNCPLILGLLLIIPHFGGNFHPFLWGNGGSRCTQPAGCWLGFSLTCAPRRSSFHGSPFSTRRPPLRCHGETGPGGTGTCDGSTHLDASFPRRLHVFHQNKSFIIPIATKKMQPFFFLVMADDCRLVSKCV